MGGDKIRWWCTLGSAVCVSTQLPLALAVLLTCCNGLITGDTPWALGDANYHLTGSYYKAGDKIRCWCTLGSAVCVSSQLPWALSSCLACCNSLITRDTPWALGDDNYHLTGF